ncbi:RNA polymerase sigma-54 factor [candidate division KSB1 bacterium 4484_87]|nr:MAG: RNA polymerase sigma-54 factor [candidate division KSB1 bacterium 4484_87]
MGVGFFQKPGLYMKQSPQQVLLSTLLQLPITSLEQRIQLELEQNPLLEADMELEEEMEQEMEEELKLEQVDEKDKDAEDDDDEPEVAEEEEEIDWDLILNDEDSYEIKAPREENPDEYSPPNVYQMSLPEYLLEQLNMTDLSPEELTIGEYIVWNINNAGYLMVSLESIAENLDTSIEKVEKVLKVIHTFDPPGIGARDLRECLLIQLEENAKENEKAIVVIRDYFDDFKNKRFEKIAKKMGITIDEFKQILEKITQLNPKPGSGYVTLADDSITPDVLVTKEGDEFKITLNDWNIPHLRINNRYKSLLLDKKNTSKKTKDFIKTRLEMARWLINSIHQRRVTIMKVVEAIVKRQHDFFDKGSTHLKPMILKDIADEIGMDISTVSRVTNGKYVQTDYGVFELKHFFSEKIRREDGEDVSNKEIKERIRAIIDKEDKKAPLNDSKIAEMLKDDGFHIARRTIAKYREQMGIPISRLRKVI